MNTKQFFNLLEENKDKSLLFEYAPNSLVGANYHITEVKHISVDSVDCGAKSDSWEETIVQLWESPSELEKTEFMTVFKALGILNKVGQMKAYRDDSELKVEYSNATFHTAQMYLNDYSVNEHQLIIHLAVNKTDCKAKETCGVPEPQEITLTNEEASCCTPEGGCC